MEGTPIVSPIWFYVFNFVSKFHSIISIVFSITSAAFFGILLFITFTTVEGRDDEIVYMAVPYAKKLLILTIFFGLLYVITPTKKALIEMLVAKNITVERVEKIAKAGKSVKKELKQDVIDIINSIMGNNKNREED